MWVNYKPVDVDIDGDKGIFHVFEMQIGMNEFHRSMMLNQC